MELAKLFASVGFKVETDGLTTFRQELQTLKTEIKDAADGIGKFKGYLKGLNKELVKFKTLVDPGNLTNWHKSMTTALENFYRVQSKNAQSQFNATHFADAFILSISRLHAAMLGRVPEIEAYSNAIAQLANSFQALKAATAGIQRFRQVPSTALTQTQGGAGGSRRGSGRRGNGYEDNQYIGYWGRASGIAKSPLAAFVRPMLPTGMGLFNAVAGGYAFKEVVKTGREMTALELKMKSVSNESAQFAENMSFTKNMAQEMGLDIQQVGDAYANIFVAAKKKMASKDIETMFRGFNKYYTSVHMTSEGQRLANLAIQQMFGKGKMQAQEVRLQMGQRVAPFIDILTEVASHTIKGFTTLDDAMKKGLLDPAKMLPLVAEKLGMTADTGNAYTEALNNSQVAQQRATNAYKFAAYELMKKGGLDHALKELFNSLSGIIPLVVQLAKWLVTAALAVVNAVKALWDLKYVFVALAGAIALLNLSAVAAGLTGISRILLVLIPQLWAANAAALKLYGTLAGFLYIFSSINDYMSGEDNWLHGLQLSLELAVAYFEEFFIKVQGGWERFKMSFETHPVAVVNELVGDVANVALGPFKTAHKWIGGGIDSFIADFQNASNNYGQSMKSTVQSPAAPNVTVHVNMGDIVGAGVLKDPEKFGQHAGKAAADELSKIIGGVGMWGK